MKIEEITLAQLFKERLAEHKKVKLETFEWSFYVIERKLFGKTVCCVDDDRIYYLDKNSPYYNDIIRIAHEWEAVTGYEVTVSTNVAGS